MCIISHQETPSQADHRLVFKTNHQALKSNQAPTLDTFIYCLDVCGGVLLTCDIIFREGSEIIDICDTGEGGV